MLLNPVKLKYVYFVITHRETTKTTNKQKTMPPRIKRKGKNNKNLQHPLSIGLLFVRDAPMSKTERVTGKCYKWRRTKRMWDGKNWRNSMRALDHASHEGKCGRHSTAKPYACIHEGCDKRFARSHHLALKSHERTHAHRQKPPYSRPILLSPTFQGSLRFNDAV